MTVVNAGRRIMAQWEYAGRNTRDGFSGRPERGVSPGRCSARRATLLRQRARGQQIEACKSTA